LQALASDEGWLKWLMDAGNAEQALACVAMDEYSGEETAALLDEKTSRFILHTIRQAADENSQVEAQVLRINDTENALLLMFRHSASHGRHQMRNQLSEIIDRVVSHLKQYLNLSVSIGVSDFVRGPLGWKDRYLQARELVRLRFFEHDRTVCYPEHGLPTSEEVRLQSEPWDRKLLLLKLETGEPWEEEMAKGFLYWRSFRTRPQSELQQLLRAFLWEIGALLNARSLDWDAISENDSLPHERLQLMNRFADIQKWMSGLLGKTASQLDPRRLAADSSPRLTDKAKKYIHEHYHEPISLTQISEWVGVSESYLSKQFVKETGDNFISYLTNLRIRKAIEMMVRGGMKLFEIAERVGYPNPEHFSRNFKKVTGLTPQQYREEIKSKEQKMST
jgi:two-component system response regulator YesN